MDAVELFAVLAAVALLASVISVEVGITVALVELTLGVVVGNVLHLETQDWLTLIAGFASIVLTFLAGMEVDPRYMQRRLGATVGIGVVSFVGPFVVASLVAYFAARLERSRLPDRRHGALYDVAGRRLLGAG